MGEHTDRYVGNKYFAMLSPVNPGGPSSGFNVTRNNIDTIRDLDAVQGEIYIKGCIIRNIEKRAN